MAEKFEQLDKKLDQKLTVAEMYLNRPRKWWIYTLIVLVLVVLVAKTIGCTLPLLAHRLGFDPAVMASPLITTIVDAISLTIYFMIATNVLHLTV